MSGSTRARGSLSHTNVVRGHEVLSNRRVIHDRGVRARAIVGSFAGLFTLVVAGCAEDPVPEEPEEGLYTLQLDHYEETDPPTPLRIANDTLVVPLGRGALTQVLTLNAPGDLILEYTRVGCGIDDPDFRLREVDETRLPAGPYVQLTTISIDEISGEGGDGTCFSYRSRDGSWHALLQPSEVVDDGERRTSSLILDVEDVDAVAIFLSTYTQVSQITYRIGEE